MNDEAGVSARIKEVIGENVSAFARRSGLGESLLRQYIAGSKPGLEKAAAIAKAGQVSLLWLATGEGPMHLGAGVGVDRPELDDFALVTVYDVEASAGHGAEISHERPLTEIAFRRDWLKNEGFNVGALAALRTKGDSMEPTIPDGSLLLIDTSVRQVRDGAIYVLRFDGVLLAKRLQRLVDGAVRVTSDNRTYAEEVVDADRISQLDIVGRVIWIGHRA